MFRSWTTQIHEKPETFTVNLSNGPHYSTLVDNEAVGTILDNEEPMVASVTRTHGVVNERHPGPLLFAVALSHPTTTNHERNPAVAWQTVDGTATGGEDYTAGSGTVRFDPGEITGFFDLGIIDDNLIEATLESFSVELLAAGSRLVTLSSTNSSYETSIRDNESLTASVVANSENVVEGQDASFTVYLTGGTTIVDTSVTFELSESDSAKTYVDTDDYGAPIGNLAFPSDNDTGRAGTLTIPAGEYSGTITYPIAEDTEDEEDGELMELRIFSVSDGLKGGSISTTRYKDSSLILDKGSLTASIEGTPTVAEGGTATFTVSLSQATDEAVLVGWATRSAGDTLELWETAEPDADYSADSGSVTVAPGGTSATFTVDTTDDTLVENTEYFVVTLEDATKGTGLLPEIVPLGAYFATGTITDNDSAPDGLTVTATPDRVTEGEGEIDLFVTVSLGGTSQFTTDTPVSLEFVGRTATIGEDFTAQGVDRIIPAGDSSFTATIPFTVLDDDVREVNERVVIRASSRALANDGEARIVIEDNDLAPGRVMLTISPTEADESVGTVSIRVNAALEGGTTLPADVQMDITTSGVTAVAGEDFETATGTLTLPAGERRATGILALTVVDDTLDEDDETLIVTGSVTNINSLNLDGGLPVDTASFITIRDNDAAPTSIGLSVTGDAITENGGPATLTVRATLLGGGTRRGATTVALEVVDITATLTDDYSIAGALPTITIPSGALYGEAAITITPVQDTLYEGDESIGLRGNNTDPGLPVNGVRLIVQEDDPAPTTIALSIDPSSISEGVGSSYADVTATIEGGSTLTGDTRVRMMLDSGGSRVRSTPFSSLVIPAGQMSGKSKLLLTNLDDDVDDDDETLEFTGTTDNPELTVKSGQLVITDDDTAGISISPNSLTVAEGGQSRFYTIKLNSQPTSNVTVTVNLPANAGFSVAPGSVTFTPQDWRPKSIGVTAVQDEDFTDEPAATITHTISSNDTLYRNASAGSVTVTVRDDDDPTVSVEFGSATYSVEESDDTGTTETQENEVVVTVKLSADPARTVTIPIEKTDQDGASSADYSGVPADVTFNSGETQKSFTFTATDDDVDDDGESVKLTFGNTLPTGVTEGTTNETVVSINDDDDSIEVRISKTSLTIEEGSSDTYTVVLGTQPGGDVTVTIGGNTGTDVSLGKTVLTFTDGNWETAQTVTVTADHDGDDADEEDVSLTHTAASAADSDYDGISVDSVTVSVTDDDKPRVVIYPTSVTLPEGYTTQYTVELNTQPIGDVTVTINDPTDNTDVTADPATLTFTTANWHTTQLVTVNAATDADEDEDSATITHSVSGHGTVTTAADVDVTVLEDDPVEVTASFEMAAYTVAESDDTSTTDVFENEVAIKVTLSADPERTVAIPLTATPQNGATSDDYSGVPAILIFSPGETEREFTFAATDDSDDDDDESVKLTFSDLPAGVTAATLDEATVSITDDDLTQVTVSFNVAAQDLDEAGGFFNLEVVLDKAADRALTFDYIVTFEGGASAPDLLEVPSAIQVPKGWTRPFHTIRAIDNQIDDDGKTITFRFDTLPEAVTLGTPSELVITIIDDDEAGVTVIPTGLTVAEGEDETYTVVLDSQPTADVTVDIGGTTDTDVSVNPSSLTFTSGDWNSAKTVTVTAAQDTDSDNDSVTLTHSVTSSDTLYEGVSTDSVDVTVDDDEDPSVSVEFGSATYSVEESDDTTTTETKENEVVVTVKLSADPKRAVAVPIVKTDQDGASSADYSGVPASVTFNSGETSKSFTFAATDDSVDDDGESVKLTFGTTFPAGVTEGTTNESVVSINDDDLPADVDVEFEQSSYTVYESDDLATTETKENEVVVKVTLSEDPERTVVVPVTSTDLNGATSADYSGVPASVTFNSGETQKSFTFTATADTVDDDGESVKLTFTNLPTGVTGGTTAEAVVAIVDDDDPSVNVQFGSATYNVEESDDTTTTETKENEVSVTVKLSADPERTVTIPIIKTDQGGASSADYSGVPTSVTFNFGETSKTFTFKAESDTDDDDGESVKLTFTNLPTGVTEGTTKETVISINDDDSSVIQRQTNVSVSFKIPAYSVPEGGTARIETTLSDDPERTVEIPVLATGGTGITGADYSGVPLTVVFDSGETEKAFTFTAVQDQDDEDVETVTLTFGNLPDDVSEGSITEATINIRDSLRVSFGAAEYSAYEGGDNAVVTVKLDGPAIQETVIPLNAAGMNGATSDDWSGVPDEITFAAGEISKKFPVVAVDDTVEDDDESVQLTFRNLPAGVVEGNPSTATVVLMNMETTQANTQCPDDSGRRIILDSQGQITVSGESQFWRLNLDPYRTYLIEVFGSDSEKDATGADLPSEDLTLPDPRVISFYDDDKSTKFVHNTVGNRLTLVRGSTESGWHRIEVSGGDETGTYRIRIRVNNVCLETNGLAVYPYFGGPDGYTLDIPANTSSTRRISIKQVGTQSILGDNWNWYWDSEPDVDWFKALSLEAGQTYNIEAWAPDGFPSEHQATDLKIAGVYDSGANLISGTASSTGKSVNLTFEPAADGDYYVAVSSGSGDRTGVYKIKIVESEGPDSSARGRNDSDQDSGWNEEETDGQESRDTEGEAEGTNGKEENPDEPEHTNTPTTGRPVISREARVGQTLSIDTSGIEDNNGLEDADFTYLRRARGADILGANRAIYTLKKDQLSEVISFRVAFRGLASGLERYPSPEKLTIVNVASLAADIPVLTGPGRN